MSYSHRKPGRIFGEEYRSIIVCVDRADGNLLSGSFYNPYQSNSTYFSCLFDLICGIDCLLNEMNNVQCWRSMMNADGMDGMNDMKTCPDLRMKGEIATFCVRVVFRRNASWQGVITWIEGNVEEPFRSALDMSYFMRSKCGGISGE